MNMFVRARCATRISRFCGAFQVGANIPLAGVPLGLRFSDFAR